MPPENPWTNAAILALLLTLLSTIGIWWVVLLIDGMAALQMLVLAWRWQAARTASSTEPA